MRLLTPASQTLRFPHVSVTGISSGMENSKVGRSIIAVAVLGLLGYGFLQIITPFISTIVWSGIIVSTTWPIYSRLQNKMGGRESLSAAMMVVLLAFTFLVIVGPLFANISKEAGEAASKLSTVSFADQDLLPLIDKLPSFAAEKLRGALSTSSSIKDQARDFFVQYSGSAVDIVGSLAKGVAQGAVQLILILLTSFFVYRSGAGLGADIKRACERIGGERFLNLLAAVQGTVKGAVLGLLMTALAQGLLAGLAFLVTGAPVPILLGFATAVFSFIPFGAPLIYIPAIAFVAATSGIGWAIGLAIWCVGVVSNADNIIRPLFISQATSLPILLVFFATFGGLLSYGMLGLFIGPALAAVAVTLWREFVR